ncbi:hypothetical protein FSP39_007514 [Pinctada imbricata]|uniref:Protein brambleberry n=1 Tax=Pinctada imbricata TaxID=66713 RepID=A0AA88YGV9_PINIB|nr:hypothetical protein FSP39_007514 [Pinctada imbricata]
MFRCLRLDQHDMRFISLFLIFSSLFLPSSCLLESVKDWLFGDGTGGTAIVSQGTKFEVLSTDEKFLKYATALAELSPLDACYHIVVFSLKKKCGELSEEDLGKLAVQLLNCQSQAEGRPTFKCSQQMTIAECTKNMDGPTWNAYQIVGNRARAMCYATQQDQFRKMTEMTVNDLSQAAHDQLQSLDQLKHGQEILHSLTSETVRQLYESQKELLGTHQQLRIAHENVMTHVTDNVDALVREKSLIASGNKQLADLVENIREKLDSTSKKIFEQSKTQQENHDKITDDLNKIHDKAQDALQKLDDSAKRLLQNHQEITKYYEQMFKNVNKINSSVWALMTTVNNMQAQLEQKISWFSQILGSSEEKLALILHTGKHVGFYLLIMLLAAYLNLPRFSRFAILVACLANGVAEIRHQEGLSFQELTGVIICLILANIMYHIWRPKHYGNHAAFLTQGCGPQSTGGTTPARYTTAELQNLHTLLENVQNTLSTSLHSTNSSLPSPIRERRDVDSESLLPPRPDSSTPEDYDHVRRYINAHFDNNSSRHSTPVPGPSSPFTRLNRTSRSSTPSVLSRVSSLCKGITRAGTPCRLPSQHGYDYCHRHKT